MSSERLEIFQHFKDVVKDIEELSETYEGRENLDEDYIISTSKQEIIRLQLSCGGAGANSFYFYFDADWGNNRIRTLNKIKYEELGENGSIYRFTLKPEEEEIVKNAFSFMID